MGLSQLWISLGNWVYDSATRSSFGRLFHTRAASDPKDLSPYLVVFTRGTSACFTALKLEVDVLISTRSFIYSGDILFIVLKTSHAICFILRT